MMTSFILLGLVVLYGVTACLRAGHAALLKERDGEAWEQLQKHQDEHRRHRQELLGKVVLAVARHAGGWFRKEDY